MFKVSKQIKNIYAISAFGSFQIAGASWVALLAMRGFSMIQIGIGESLFHVTSLLFEIPSGVISDVFGRKKTMIMSQCFCVVSAFLMVISKSTAGVYLAIMLNALAFNFASGTREALVYDSLKKAGQEDEYNKYAATETMIYRIGNALAMLCAGLALVIGYQKAYLADMVLGVLCLYFAFGLKEVPASEVPINRNAIQRILDCVRTSIQFLQSNKKAICLMLWNSMVGGIATLLLFFLQAQLPLKGLSNGLLGPALFFMGLGGAAGARLVPNCSHWRYRKISILSILGVLAGSMSVLTRCPLIMCVGGFMASFCDDFIQVRSDVLLNDMVPSSQRATLISVSSLCFSIIMMILSPVAGWIFSLL